MMNPDELARRCAETMWQGDHAARGLGIEILAVSAGSSRLRMKVRSDMANAHGICHGGFLFALADTAFAYACNSFNVVTVASGGEINFLAPVAVDDVLEAHATLRHQGGRSGVFDVEVLNQGGRVVALFRGRSTRLKQEILGGAAHS